MINSLKIIHIQGDTTNQYTCDDSAFEIRTCQRAIIIQTIPFLSKSQSCEYYESADAYQFLLETICGLKSKLIGESEIVSQFKMAFQKYILKTQRSCIILKILEKLFKDAKEIRRDYLVRVGQQSYAGITRKIIQNKSNSKSVLILGSGQLATDMIKQLDKKFDVYISARNSLKVEKILSIFESSNIKVIPWGTKSSYSNFDTIINTIGMNEILFDHTFFKTRNESKSLFIDLASPSVIETSHDKKNGVFRLTDIFSHGEALNIEKQAKITSAQKAIGSIVEKRVITLGHNYPYSWEELQFS